MSQKIIFVFVLVVIFTVVAPFNGQTSYSVSSGAAAPNVAPGTPAGSYALGGFESVNPYSGKINFSLPLLTVGGRGNAGYTINLKLQKNWSIRHDVQDKNTYQPGSETYPVLHNYVPIDYEYASDIELLIGPGIMKGQLAGTNRQYFICGANLPCYDETLTRLTFEQADGTRTEFRDVVYGGKAIRNFTASYDQSRGTHWVSIDGTSATFISNTAIYDYQLKAGSGEPFFPSGTLYLANGTRYAILNGFVQEITDVHGNKTTTRKDSLGREISYTEQTHPSNPDIYVKTITYRGTNGALRTVKVNFMLLEHRLAPGFQLGGNPPHGLFPLPPPEFVGATFDSNTLGVASAELPDGRKYEFKYNSYGELAEVKLPTGGRIEYVWQTTPGLYQTSTEYKVYRRVEKRRVYEGGALQSETRYSAPDAQETFVTVENYLNNNGTLILDNKIKHTYADSPAGSIISPLRPTDEPFWLSGRETQTEIFDRNEVLLRKTVNEWEAGTALAQNPNAPINVRLAEVTETLSDTSQVSKKTFDYDQFNNQTDIYEYEYAVGQSTVLRRRTHTHYLDGANYISHTGAHLRRLPDLSWVSTDADGYNIAAKTEFKYDETPLAPRTNVIGWADPNNPQRGNLTKTRSWLKFGSAPESWLETKAKYDVLGNVVETTDAKNQISTLAYQDNFGMPNGEARTSSAPGYLNGQGVMVSPLNGQNTYAFPTSGTNTMGWIIGYSQFDYFTGQPVDVEDLNEVVSSSFYNDPLDRPTQVVSANNISGQRRQTSFFYDDFYQKKATVKSDLNTFDDNLLKSESFYDGLGRTIESRRYESDGNFVATKTIPFAVLQDPQTSLWRAATQVSNPYRPNAGETPVYTKSLSDALGRTIKVIMPDGAVVKTEYSGNAVTVTDQAGKQRRSIVDALGQLIRVDEPTGAGLGTAAAPNQPTYYDYDVLNNLTSVQQSGGNVQQCGQGNTACTQTRTFVYDSLSRLKSVTNPEMGAAAANGGSIAYQYDNNGNLTRKTDARGVTTDYAYDALNRVTSRTYSAPGGLTNYQATPNVAYTYDDLPNAKGRLTKVASGGSEVTEYQEFDELGRIKKSRQKVGGVTYGEPQTYTYNLAGMLIEQKYPSGRVVTYNLDTDGDLASVESKKRQNEPWQTYADNYAYTAAGAVGQMRLGNNLWETTVFNSRLQPTLMTAGTVQGGSDRLRLEFGYGSSQNNGNVQTQTITVSSSGGTSGFTATQSYAYDELNRLKSATETTPSQSGWKQTYTYDRYGNRRFDTDNNNTTTIPAGCPNAVCNPTIEVNKNRLHGSHYDSAGNVMVDGTAKFFIYDAENKQTKVLSGNQTLGEYTYDGDGRRVRKIALENGQQVTTIFVYDAFGKLVAEYATQVESQATAKTSYLTSDHLGSPRITTDKNGAVISRRDFMPFGEEMTAAHTPQRSANLGYTSDTVRQKFTSYERDIESSLDFAEARMYNFQHGRFTAVDPYNIVLEVQYETDAEKARAMLNRYIIEPQQWNRYAYVINNPLKYIDPTGEIIYLTGTADEQKAALKRMESLLGDERMRQVTVSYKNVEGVGQVTELSFSSDRDSQDFSLVGTGDEGNFSQGMRDIIGSSEAVEYRLAESFEDKSGSQTTLKYGGAATVDKSNSKTGNVQIFVHPTAAISKAESNMSTTIGRSKSSDGGALYFSNETIDAHEFGHAREGISGGKVNSANGQYRARQMENHIRERQKGNLGPRRRIRE